MSRCPVCETKENRPAPHAAMTREYYRVLIKPLRHVAWRCGYALAVHGSLGFDIDLIAVPWRDSAVSAEYLVESIQQACKAIIGVCEIWLRDKDHLPAKKPCGRLAWSLYLVPEGCGKEGPYIDLSVMPVPKND